MFCISAEENMKRRVTPSTVKSCCEACVARYTSVVCESCEQVKLAPWWSHSCGILGRGVSEYGVLHPWGAITLGWIIYVVFLICMAFLWAAGDFCSRLYLFSWLEEVRGQGFGWFPVHRGHRGRREKADAPLFSVWGQFHTVPGRKKINIQIPALHCDRYPSGGGVGVADMRTLLLWIPTPDPRTLFLRSSHICYDDNGGQWQVLEVKLGGNLGGSWC